MRVVRHAAAGVLSPTACPAGCIWLTCTPYIRAPHSPPRCRAYRISARALVTFLWPRGHAYRSAMLRPLRLRPLANRRGHCRRHRPSSTSSVPDGARIGRWHYLVRTFATTVAAVRWRVYATRRPRCRRCTVAISNKYVWWKKNHYWYE